MKPQICPKCKVAMIRRRSKFGNNYWWGCSMYPKCTLTVNEHPDGTLMSTPATDEVKQLRTKAHRMAEKFWGKWYPSNKEGKEAMYFWLNNNTRSGHIGKMQKKELLELIEKLKELK